MTTILIGVDRTERSEDAIAFGSQWAEAVGATVIVACAFPYRDLPSRSSSPALRQALADEARSTASEMRAKLTGVPEERSTIQIVANPSPAHALHDLAEAEHADLIVVGSTHTGRAGRVLPGSTGERLIHGAPCAVAVVPKDYHGRPLRRVGVAYNATDEATGALAAGTELAAALGAELELIGVVAPDSYDTPTLIGAPSTATLREDVERHVQESLDAATPAGAANVRLSGAPADELARYSERLDLLVTGSRGYGPLRSVLVGGVSGRVIRSAQCPVVVVPRGVTAPSGAATAA